VYEGGRRRYGGAGRNSLKPNLQISNGPNKKRKRRLPILLSNYPN